MVVRKSRILQTRSPSLELIPRELPPFRFALLVMALETGWSTKLAWKPSRSWTGLKFSVARRKTSAKSVALLAKVAVPKSWLWIKNRSAEYAKINPLSSVFLQSLNVKSNLGRWC